MFRRRRKPAVSWLPIIGSTTGTEPAVVNVNSFDGFQTVAGTSDVTTTIFPLTYDTPPEQALAALQQVSLGDFEQSAYRLRRLVGKLFIGMAQTTEQAVNRPPFAVVTAGFIVLKVDETTGTPLAGSSGPYSPQLAENIRDPWIWRRSWGLSDNFAQPASESPVMNFPQTNAEYGSVQDGPHIDTKIGRVIMPDERLFFVLSNYSPTVHTNNGQIGYVLDIRILASMRKATNRRNASR